MNSEAIQEEILQENAEELREEFVEELGEEQVKELAIPQDNTLQEIHLQLTPFSDSTTPPPSIVQLVDRNLKDGMVLKLGRQVFRDGKLQTKASEHGLDIWFTSKVVSRNHAEMWAKDGQVYIKDVGSSSGTFLNKMRLSPSNKLSRPYPLKDGDILQFGVDYKGKSEDIYKAVLLRVSYTDHWMKLKKNYGSPVKFQGALKNLLAATNPYATNTTDTSKDDPENSSIDCCICIGPFGPYQALFISPCSHCFHFKCVSSMLVQSTMFQCPMCRQVANLTASVSMESLNMTDCEEPLTVQSVKVEHQREQSTASDSVRNQQHLLLDALDVLEGVGLRRSRSHSERQSSIERQSDGSETKRSSVTKKISNFLTRVRSIRRSNGEGPSEAISELAERASEQMEQPIVVEEPSQQPPIQEPETVESSPQTQEQAGASPVSAADTNVSQPAQPLQKQNALPSDNAAAIE